MVILQRDAMLALQALYYQFRPYVRPSVLNDTMAIILRYFSEFDSFRGAQRKSG